MTTHAGAELKDVEQLDIPELPVREESVAPERLHWKRQLAAAFPLATATTRASPGTSLCATSAFDILPWLRDAFTSPAEGPEWAVAPLDFVPPAGPARSGRHPLSWCCGPFHS
ncbi:hypothetical protein [Sinosporangium siamense]|uniref:Uncharacterized protein n=1 Tax=Sinosporangium siamense TaxID=1367973 RepID=A0A919VEG3_9ACTN|nr:hypothetical protein [Sinosporangium siamense]GII95089.1 hypothetical protein Ssi02_53200 [Sinosporangium siamense]